MRYFLELAFSGKAYHGWQRQPNAASVQEEVEKALRILTQEDREITGAGRTDAGVHALQLFAHFDTGEIVEEELMFRLNSLLPSDIAVNSLFQVPDDAHARFDALSRTYEYHIIQKKDPFLKDTAFYVKRELDLNSMNKAAEILLEYTGFKSFSRSRTDVRTYNCKLEKAIWEKKDQGLIFTIKADRFLRNMVRAVVGTLLEIGLGKMEVEDLHSIIKSESRSEAGASVPAHGLFLTKVEYPKNTKA